MSKGLEKLEELKKDLTNRSYSNIEKLDRYKIIEKELKKVDQLEKQLNMVHKINAQLCIVRDELYKENELLKKKAKALEIIKETPIFAWYVSIYKNAYEMIADVKGFRLQNSAEELDEMFNLLKEVLL